jgi:hypothetical protein
MFQIEELFQAYYDARRNKRSTTSQLRFELNLEENVVQLYRDLCSRKYVVGTSMCFVINDSVQREVFAADFRDRVVHHFLYNRLSPFFERKFIYDSYSCRKGKGTLLGIKRLQHHIRSCSKNGSMQCYVLKLDLKGYFMNVDKNRLFNIINSSLPVEFPDREFLLWLTKEIVLNESIINCRIKGKYSDWEGLPEEKSLFHASNGKGMPIGNLTSQLFSNIYLNQFDHWIKRELKCKHYGRYVDDFYIIHTSKDFLISLLPLIDSYLKRELGLYLHPKKMHLQDSLKGVRFLGCVVCPYSLFPASRIRSNMKKALVNIDAGEMTPKKIRSTINSYLGLLSHFSTYKFVQRSLRRLVVPYYYGYFKRSSGVFRYKISL